MDFKELQNKLKLLWLFIYEKIKETVKLPYAKTYIVLAFLVFLPVCIVITFPYETIIQYKLQDLSKTNSGIRSFVIGDIDFGLFSGLSMSNVTIILNNEGNGEIFFKDLTIDSALIPYKILVKKKFDGAIHLGGFKYASDKTTLSFDLNSNIDVVLDAATSVPLDGDMKFILESATFKLDEVELPESAGGLKIPLGTIRIKFIDFRSKITRKRLTIDKCTIAGDDLNGSIKGNIVLQSMYKNSRIDLTMSIDSNSKLIKENPLVTENEIIKNMLAQYTNSSGQISLKLSGILARPKLGTDSGGSGSPRMPMDGGDGGMPNPRGMQ